MKTILRINGIVFVLSLIGLTTFGLIAKDEIRNQLHYEHYIENYDASEIDQLKINADNRNVIINESTTNQISIEFYISEMDRYTLTLNNEIFSLEIKANWFESIFYSTTIFNISLDPALVTIKISAPANVLSSLDILTTNGTINMDNLSVDSVFAKTTNGTIKLKNATFEDGQLISSNGNIDVQYISGSNLTLRTSNGEIKGDHITIDELKANTSNGHIKFSDLSSFKIETTSSNGNINLRINGIFEDYKTIVTTANGTIKINDNKSFSGTYHSDKANSVSAITSNGSIYLYFE